jgi:hypothetical protein
MDEETRLALKAIATAHEELMVKFAGLVAIVGSMVEKYPIDQARVDAWCRAIAQQSDPVIGVGQTATQRAAHDILRGIERASKG